MHNLKLGATEDGSIALHHDTCQRRRVTGQDQNECETKRRRQGGHTRQRVHHLFPDCSASASAPINTTHENKTRHRRETGQQAAADNCNWWQTGETFKKRDIQFAQTHSRLTNLLTGKTRNMRDQSSVDHLSRGFESMARLDSLTEKDGASQASNSSRNANCESERETTN